MRTRQFLARYATASMLVVAGTAVVGLAGSGGAVNAAANGTVTGKVFLDKDSDGAIDTGEGGVASVEVKAYDSAGTAVGTATTGSDGTYSLTVANSASTQVRIEFATPNGYQSSFAGTDSGTSIQFVTVPATSVDYGVLIPGNYCADNVVDPMVATNCQNPGSAASAATHNNVAQKSAIAYTTWTGRAAFTKIVDNQTVGATWGLASQASTGLVWASAFLRRHSAFGPKGIGGLYVSHPLTGLVTSFDLAQYMTLSADNTQFTDAARGFRDDVNLSLDSLSFAGIGKVGIGDIEFSADGTQLYVVNLYERKLYTFPVAGTVAAPTLGTPTSVAITDPGCTNANDVRPFGLKVVSDGILVGVVCSNETANATSFLGTRRPGSGYIRKISTAGTWSTVTTINFGYDRAVEENNCKVVADLTNANAQKCEAGRWKAWTDSFSAIKNAVAANSIWKDGSKYYFSQPIIMGIDVLADGSIVAGVSDRLSRQLGAVNLDPTDTGATASNPGGTLPWVTAFTRGDTLLLCNTGTLSAPVYAQESDGTCGSRSSTSASRPGAGLNATSPYREFFKDQLDENDIPAGHQENSQGAVLVWPPSGTQEILVTAMDPGWQYYEGGIRWYRSSNGEFSNNSANVYFRSLQSAWPVNHPNGGSEYYPTTFGKSSGMGDLEVLCNMAPVQIGNRVWIDTDKDGIQDPGETPVKGVTVRVYDATGTTLLGTAVTDENGEYYFSSNVTEAAAGDGNNVGGGIAAGSAYVIRFDNPADYAAGGPLSGYLLTTKDATDAASGLDDSIDSDASTVSEYPQITTYKLLPGVNDHTFDVGFYATTTPVGMGNYTWVDADKDGLQDADEQPLAGVVVTLFNPDGTPALDLAGKAATATTDAKGYYFIDNLTAGSYYAKFTLPANYTFTKKGDGTSALDSNPDTATGITPVFTIGASASGDTVADTDSATLARFVNPTIDAGVIFNGPKVSVGDFVWWDLDRDGIQDVGETPIAGVTLSITKADGSPVTDVNGKAITTTTTDANGKYSFDNLP
ncbi:MAG: carboxypeptidase regulatory-like domain-containing protein, partial [Acidobacteria bacterium]|nr:carboxypeptidase regulatory-like domain-containing protein [Acidobacteriota bacterium]